MLRGISVAYARRPTRQWLQPALSCPVHRLLGTSRRCMPPSHVYMPDAGFEFGIVKSFPRKEGSFVEVGDVVAEVEAGPSQLLEVQTARAGEVTKLLKKQGELVKPGEALVELNVTFAETVLGFWRSLEKQK
eukprot:TRINITY_DN24299_c0_g1_i1.p1 TRINITY_DN24299_c0_g1~~TRINITY_DN24299_c0_g1_i1.p1  ORF type:complete len:132 (-),score=32.48 TRINITY_DN24299_c0_g1_i1:29-424(-)